MVFSKNVQDDTRKEVMATWGCRGVTQYEKYLSLPPIVGKAKKKAFSKIKTKM